MKIAEFFRTKQDDTWPAFAKELGARARRRDLPISGLLKCPTASTSFALKSMSR